MGMGPEIFLHPDIPSQCRETVALYCTGSQNELEVKGGGGWSCLLAFILHENKLCMSGMSQPVSFVKGREAVKHT